MFDDQQGVAQVSQAFQDFDQPAGVARVQPDREGSSRTYSAPTSRELSEVASWMR